MSDEEFAIQMAKILLGFVVGFAVVGILYHVNHNLTTLITQNGEIINLLKK